MTPQVGWCVACTLGEGCPSHDKRDCLVAGCKNAVHSGYYCPTHYRHKRLDRPIREYGRGECAKCDQPHYAKGLCRSHYRRR